MYRSILFLAPVLLFSQAPTTAPKAAAKKTAAVPKKASATAAKTAVTARPPAKAAAAKPATKTATPVAFASDDEKAVYALGLSMYRSLGQFDLSPAELDLLKRALSDAAAGKPAIDPKEWGPKLQELAMTRRARSIEKEKAASEAFLARAAAEPGAIRTESGIVYQELVAGTGASPQASDTVKVHYRGTLRDGTEFDSSYARNEPASFALTGVIRCWTEGVQKIKVGGKARLVCPSNLAYGDQGRPSIPPGAALVFEVELLEIPAAAAVQ